MPIKQLQLRGISRNPSDRATADGGCAESLNVHLDQNETAPTLPPVDVSDDVYGASRSASDKHQIVYIHKMAGIVNYIAVKDSGSTFNVYAYGSSLSGGSGMATIYTATGTGETLKNVSSIGNTLIVYSNSQPHYFLFKDGAYLSLGSRIPVPAIEVASMKADNRYATAGVEEELKETNDSNIWNAASGESDENHAALLGTVRNIWDSVSLEISDAQNDGVFVAPFFIRYALRLYDGSLIQTSTPILCGGGSADEWVKATLGAVTGGDEYEINISFLNAFRVWLHGSYILGNWGDIVKSLDIFASTPIYAPAMNAAFFRMGSNGDIVFDGMGEDAKEKTVLDEVLSKGQFYKVMSINLNEDTSTTNTNLGKLVAGTLKLSASASVNGEGLALNEDMPDGYRDGNQYIPEEGTMNFNNRLMLIGAREELSRGDRYLNGQMAGGDWLSPSGLSYFTLRFKIVDSATGKAHYVLANYGSGTSTSLYQAYFHNSGGAVYLRNGNDYRSSGTVKKCEPYAWICYPDTRCTQVEVYCSSNTSGKIIPMQQHPMLECSYAFIGFGTSFRYPGSAYESISTPSSFSEDPVIVSPNKLLLSELENPFLFPAGNILTFSDRLVGASTTSVPLSEGQFGEFPMYVFTEGGIRMLVTTAEGTFAATMTPPNLSRHVAIPGTILPLEQAVVFITKKGVMLLAGSRVMELSQGINGEPFVLSGPSGSDLLAIRNGLSVSTWSNLVPATIDTSTFMGFMTGAKPAYDHNGARLIFFNPSKTYQYVYMMETKTWHKIDYHLYYNAKILNSYPECLVSLDPAAAPAPLAVMDYSTVLDDATIYADAPSDASDPVQPVKGIIVTRPFDLGEPDIRKAIRNIRIRGYYNREDVQYILLGSFDGHTWKHMTSLRGGSYKMFRLILLTRLMPKERISWIDVDYESRMTNRLR